jgi:hypothetical protein
LKNALHISKHFIFSVAKKSLQKQQTQSNAAYNSVKNKMIDCFFFSKYELFAAVVLGNQSIKSVWKSSNVVDNTACDVEQLIKDSLKVAIVKLL